MCAVLCCVLRTVFCVLHVLHLLHVCVCAGLPVTLHVLCRVLHVLCTAACVRVCTDQVYSDTKRNTRQALLKQIEKERDGELIDRALLRNILDIFIEVCERGGELLVCGCVFVGRGGMGSR